MDRAPQPRSYQGSNQNNSGVEQDSVDAFSGDDQDTVDGESVSELLVELPSEEQSYRETVRGVRAYI